MPVSYLSKLPSPFYAFHLLWQPRSSIPSNTLTSLTVIHGTSVLHSFRLEAGLPNARIPINAIGEMFLPDAPPPLIWKGKKPGKKKQTHPEPRTTREEKERSVVAAVSWGGEAHRSSLFTSCNAGRAGRE